MRYFRRDGVHAVAPHLQNLEQQNAELRQRLAVEGRHSLDQRVERAVPNYREIDRNPGGTGGCYRLILCRGVSDSSC
jgi:hypothetical protein